MHLSRNATLVVGFGLSFSILACAQSTQPDPTANTGGGGTTTTGGGGTGGEGGSGGSGGSDCTPEVCDGQDNDCDGQIDNGIDCDCLAGETESCYSGPEGTDGVGPCAAGVRSCDSATNKWGPCDGEVLPEDGEKCDGIDNDCNGQADDGLPDIVCGVGACLVNAPACVNGQPGTCVPGTATPEICDGIDNNCNQLVDEAFPEDGMSCDSGQLGVCMAGKMMCMAGALSCVADQMPTGELCDDLDNDCNGAVDDNIPGTGGTCSTGMQGVCGPGTISCQNGIVDCFSDIPASPEICDGLDNDCDGSSDENNPEGGGACDTGQLGLCQQGTYNCINGAIQCTPNAMAQMEICDGADNNCDGQIDEGNPGSGMACSCGGTTVCQAGVLFCQGCTKEVNCNNNLDDDNDNATDCADSQCALGCNAQVGPCPAGQKLLVLSSTDIPKSITDNTSVTSTIAFSETGIVTRVVLQLNITHTYDGDLDISLISPANTSIDLTSDNGGSGDNYTNTIFHDGCPSSITTGTAPFSGCYQPEAPLSTFNNQPINGTWTLNVADDAGGDLGTLSAWTLAMCIQ